MNTPLDILKKGDPAELLALFRFTLDEPDKMILLRFGFWARYFFPKYFKENDAEFHRHIDELNLLAYRGTIRSFTDIVFRGGAKTTRTKLFIAFCILNDKNTHRRFYKILTKDAANSKQSVTDIYNMFVQDRVRALYPLTFQKTDQKREESMAAFTTANGVKVKAGTVGTDQRGALQEDARPDFIWFDDFETRKTLRSAVETKAIFDNMEEARTGLSSNGSCVYTCNYISERGNVHKLVIKQNEQNRVLIVPIIKNGVPTWYHSIDYIKQKQQDAEDFEGEYLCEPASGKDVLFDRETLNSMARLEPIQTVAGLDVFYKYNPQHRYAGGMDVSGGVGLDSSTAVYIDFDTVPARVVATYVNDSIKPDVFGDEIKRHAERFGECLVAPEKNNHGHATIGRLKQIYPTRKIHKTRKKSVRIERETSEDATEYGWHTNAMTKPKMLFDLAKAIENGWLDLSDPKLIMEAKSYTRNDLMDADPDPRLSTRHFDLLTAAAIAWQMKDFADPSVAERQRVIKFQQIMDNTDFDPFSVI